MRIEKVIKADGVKNQYFGDIKDYYKYGILRILGGFRDNEKELASLNLTDNQSKLSIGICWMLTPDDETFHGNDTKYLKRPIEWRNCDPNLYDFLKENFQLRNISILENTELIPYIVFYDQRLPYNLKNRKKYFNDLFNKSNTINFIFFDPDIGMQVKSCQCGNKRSSKHLYWDELKECFEKGYSILLFQHFRQRVSVDELIIDITTLLKDKIAINEYFAFEAKGAVFFLIPQECHYNLIKAKARRISQAWENKIKLRTPSNIERISAATGFIEESRIKLMKTCACGCKSVITSSAFFVPGHDGRVSGWFRSILMGSKIVVDLNPQAQALWKAWDELGKPGGYEHPKIRDAAKKLWDEMLSCYEKLLDSLTILL